MPPGPHQFGQHPVRDLADHIAAKMPAIVIEFEQSVILESVKKCRVVALAECVGEFMQRRDRSARTQHRSVIEHGARTVVETVEACSNQRTQRAW